METKNRTGEVADRLSFGNLISYGLGDFGMTVGWSFLSGYVTFFMTNYVGITAGVVGTVVLVSRLADAVSDVLVGTAVDHTQSSLGKARPWLLYGALPLTIFFILLFAVPDISDTGRLLWFIIIYNLAVTVFYTAVNVPYNSLTALMTRDPASRVKCGATRMVMGILSGVVASSLTMPMINLMGGDKAAWRLWAIIVGIFMGVCIFICFLLTKERYSVDTNKPKKEKISLKNSYCSLFGNKYWIVLTVSLILSYAMQAVTGGANIYYFKYVIGNENLMGFAAMAMAFPMMIMLILTPILTKLFNKGTLARISVIGGVLAPLVLLINPTSLFMMVIKSVLEGLLKAPFVAVSFAMIADVCDYGYWKSGVKCEGLVSSAASFGTKLGTGLGAGMVGWLLSFGGFDSELSVQPDSTIAILKFMMIGIPIILSIVNFAVLWFYRLDKQHSAIMADIEQREKI